MPRTGRPKRLKVVNSGNSPRTYRIVTYTPRYAPMTQQEAEGLAGDLHDAGYKDIRVFMLPSRWCVVGDNPENGNAVAFADKDRYNDFTQEQAARLTNRGIDKLN